MLDGRLAHGSGSPTMTMLTGTCLNKGELVIVCNVAANYMYFTSALQSLTCSCTFYYDL